MPPEAWKSRYFGSFTLHHDAQYDGDQLLGTLMGAPSEKHGRAPKVWVYPFRGFRQPERLAVRHFSRETGLRFFQLLKECREQGLAVIEKPLALLEGLPDDQVAIVTRWKGGKNLAEFLKDDSLRPEVKLRAAKKLMEQIAMLHAMGFIHGHLRLDNAVGRVGKRGPSASLVDYTRMRRAKPGEEMALQKLAVYMADDLAHAIYYKLGESQKLPPLEFKQLQGRIEKIKRKLYDRYLTQFVRTQVKLYDRKRYLEQSGAPTQKLELTPAKTPFARLMDWIKRKRDKG